MTDVGLRAPAGLAVRDGSVALGGSAVLSALLAAVVAAVVGAGAAVAMGVALALSVVGAASGSLVARERRWSGPADRVTLARAVLVGGCALLVPPTVLSGWPGASWLLVALATPALVLDAVDGYVARLTGTVSAAGARLDMELDAAFLAVLSLLASGHVGVWVLAIGAMRYVYLGLTGLFPALGRPLPSSRFRRPVAGAQGVALVAALAPAVPPAAGRAACAVALGLLLVSFAGQAREAAWRG